MQTSHEKTEYEDIFTKENNNIPLVESKESAFWL